MTDQQSVAWTAATWLNPPLAARQDGPDLVVSTRANTDFWRTTGYGFVHDNGHALLTGFPPGSAVEVTFVAEFERLFDQAGLMVRMDETTWIKAGVELSDGQPQLGAVVTHGQSDWSMAPVPDWAGQPVTLRASRTGDGDHPGPVRLRALADGAAGTAVPGRTGHGRSVLLLSRARGFERSLYLLCHWSGGFRSARRLAAASFADAATPKRP